MSSSFCNVKNSFFTGIRIELMAPNVLESDSTTELSDLFHNEYNEYTNSEYNLIKYMIIRSKHLIVDSVSKVKLNTRIDSLVETIERKFDSKHEFINSDEINGKDSPKSENKNGGKRKNRLLKLTEVPSYLRFNPWILRGYRSPDLSTIECLLSLLYLHNETINILSHTIPLLYCMAFLSSMIWRQTLITIILSYCHCLGLMSWAFGSSTYHLFMNHKSGEKCYYRLLQCDMFGIWITQSVGAVPAIYSSCIAFPLWFQYLFIGLYAILSIFSLKYGMLADSAWKRPASFTLLFLMRVVAFILRIQSNSVRNSFIQLFHLIMQDLWPLIGAVLSATRIPERYYPGVFDYFFNSHNIMHCFVIFGAIHMHLAFNYDLQWLTNTNNQLLNV